MNIKIKIALQDHRPVILMASKLAILVLLYIHQRVWREWFNQLIAYLLCYQYLVLLAQIRVYLCRIDPLYFIFLRVVHQFLPFRLYPFSCLHFHEDLLNQVVCDLHLISHLGLVLNPCRGVRLLIYEKHQIYYYPLISLILYHLVEGFSIYSITSDLSRHLIWSRLLYQNYH